MILLLPAVVLCPYSLFAQQPGFLPEPELRFYERSVGLPGSQTLPFRYVSSRYSDDSANLMQEMDENGEYPSPRSVLMKSMILPGWGQAVNRQAWKIPIIYGLFGGLAYYTVNLTQNYHDYRAAFYNRSRGNETDFRFGETPGYIPESITLNELRSRRNDYRNQRDMMYIYMALAYGLNILDAYVYAHMRSFDVSDDLSANTRISPGLTHELTPGVRVRIQLQPKQ